MKKILIADAGATKTDWCLASGGREVARVQTQGISPVHQDAGVIRTVLEKELRPQLSVTPDAVYFYGAGCTPSTSPLVVTLLTEMFPSVPIEVLSDLWGAARALCGHTAGIACILGTGTNSCCYDGMNIIRNTPPLGYILGDEGSGAVMGRDFVADVLKGLMPQEIIDAFFRETGTSQAEIIERVYRQPLANRYLASLSGVPRAHRDHPAVHQFLVNHFRRFLERNVRVYAHPEWPLHFVGGIAYSFRTELEEAAGLEGFRIGKTERSPMAGLLDFHASC